MKRRTSLRSFLEGKNMALFDTPETVEKIVNALAGKAANFVLETSGMNWAERWYHVEKKLIASLLNKEVHIVKDDRKITLTVDEFPLSVDSHKFRIRDRVYIALQEKFNGTPLFGICPYFKITNENLAPAIKCSLSGENPGYICEENRHLRCDKLTR